MANFTLIHRWPNTLVGLLASLPQPYMVIWLTADRQTYQVNGTGYHDHNCGTFDVNKVLDRWYWAWTDFGNNTINAGVQIASEFYNYQPLQHFIWLRGTKPRLRICNILQFKGRGTMHHPEDTTIPLNWYSTGSYQKDPLSQFLSSQTPYQKRMNPMSVLSGF